MNRSLATQNPVELPAELETLFGTPPLVGDERCEVYDAFFLAIAMVVRPADVIQWIYAREFADISWELQRERRIKAEIIKLKQGEARNSLGVAMTRADFERQKAGLESPPSQFRKKDSKPEGTAETKSWLPEAYMLGYREIDIIDTRIASYLFRRHTVLGEIERYSERLARKLEEAAPEIEGEFTEAAE
jgi:hypothetical protein